MCRVHEAQAVLWSWARDQRLLDTSCPSSKLLTKVRVYVGVLQGPYLRAPGLSIVNPHLAVERAGRYGYTRLLGPLIPLLYVTHT